MTAKLQNSGSVRWMVAAKFMPMFRLVIHTGCWSDLETVAMLLDAVHSGERKCC